MSIVQMGFTCNPNETYNCQNVIKNTQIFVMRWKPQIPKKRCHRRTQISSKRNTFFEIPNFQWKTFTFKFYVNSIDMEILGVDLFGFSQRTIILLYLDTYTSFRGHKLFITQWIKEESPVSLLLIRIVLSFCE